MSGEPATVARREARAGRPSPVWWLVFRREISELWVGGRALNLLILFSVLMSITAFLLATNSELSLVPPRQMVLVTLQSTFTFGLFIGLIVAAESISGERERATLEALLLTPANGRQIVFGKFLAALTPWPVALLLSIPYVTLLSQGDPVLGPGLIWGAVLGTLLTVTFTGVGMLASIWSNSNRTSLAASLLVYLVMLFPAQLPTELQSTPVGAVIQATNPLEAVRIFLQRALIDGQPLDDLRILLIAPVVTVGLALAVILVYAGPRLRLEGGSVNIGRRTASGVEATR